MKKDIGRIADIRDLLDHFYARVVKDPVIGYILPISSKSIGPDIFP